MNRSAQPVVPVRTIRRVAVLGAGTMGSQVAAHLANAGVPVFLLDVLPPGSAPGESRNKLALAALDRLRTMKPAPIMHARVLDLITPGNLEDHLEWLREVDWVLEAVVEQLPVKQALWDRISSFIAPGTIISSNTSGISCSVQASALPPVHRAQFLGTHFFNPPRYMKLMELIPTPETNQAAVSTMAEFSEGVLGKGIVVANDTPGFIANRIGGYALKTSLRVAGELGAGVDFVDAVTGPLIGRPGSATFRTLDVVGIDVFADASRNTAALTADPAEKKQHEPPAYIDEMVRLGLLGNKAGSGFYKKSKAQNGESEILSLNLQTFAYGPRESVPADTLAKASAIPDLADRLRFLVGRTDPVGKFVWTILSQVLVFCAAKLEEIANDDAGAVDRALRWGWGWQMGPFETWNALGVAESAARMEADGLKVPDWVKKVEHFELDRGAAQPLNVNILKRNPARVVRHYPGAATLVDLGNEVLALDLHFPKQAINSEYVPIARAAVQEVLRNWRGLVITASAENFCVGANLRLLLQDAKERNWASIERRLQTFQETALLLKYLQRPVVVAPRGITVGGGMEIAMHSTRTVAAAETRMGLVELGVGLIPGGGGTKEMALRAADMLPTAPSQFPRPKLIQFVGRAFETVTAAKILDSAAKARESGYLRPCDPIAMNAEQLLEHAKQAVLDLDRMGYRAVQPRGVAVAGLEGRAVLEQMAGMRTTGGFASEYDQYLAGKVAYVLCGGDLPADTLVPEQYLMDLEREVFLHLCGEPRTQARMQHMLEIGKPLGN